MNKSTFVKVLPYTILLISISSIIQWCTLPIGNTFLWWSLQGIILWLFIKLLPSTYSILPIKLFLFYLLFSAIYGGIFMTEVYWDWKLLVSNLMIFSLPLASYVYANPITLTKTLRCWLKYAWIIFLILFPFLESDAIGRFLVPLSFLSLFLPLLGFKYLLLTILAYIFTLLFGAQSRSDVIKFSLTIMLGLFCWLGIFQKYKFLLSWGALSLIIAPFVFFVLGITGVFNIFKIEEELGLEDKYMMKDSESNEYSALVDTRTFLYYEEITSAIKHDYIWMGRSIARGYESASFGGGADLDFGTKRGERQECEVSILNVFNYFGILGVLLYFIVFFFASMKAIFKSNNMYVPIVGLYVAFRWMFAWIEDFSKFDLNYLFLWIMIGICYSPWFREMDNEEVKAWIKSIVRL